MDQACPEPSSAGYARIQGLTCGMDGLENVSTADILLLNSFASSRRLVSANSITVTL